MAGMEHQQVSCMTAIALSTPDSCQHRVCAPELAFLFERNAVILCAHPSLQLAAPDFVLSAATALEQSIPVRGPPPLRIASPVSLHTTLCI